MTIVQIVSCEIARAKVWLGGMLERSLGIRGKVIDKKDPTYVGERPDSYCL